MAIFNFFSVIALSVFVTLSVGCSSREPLPERMPPSPQVQFAGTNRIESSGSFKRTKNPREIIFIHGMFLTPSCWNDWAAYFVAEGYSVAAPPWPLHEGTTHDLRQPEKLAALGKLEFHQVLGYYRELLKKKATKPILIGHSMGGLIAEILLAEGLADSAVAIDPAPMKGVISLKYSFLKSNWPAINPFAKSDKPIEMSEKDFAYAFANAQSEQEQNRLYNEYYVPESRRVGQAPTTDIAKIDAKIPRGPLLILGGSEDHVIPASLTLKIFDYYKNSPSYTEYRELAGRDHSTILSAGWRDVAAGVGGWLISTH